MDVDVDGGKRVDPALNVDPALSVDPALMEVDGSYSVDSPVNSPPQDLAPNAFAAAGRPKHGSDHLVSWPNNRMRQQEQQERELDVDPDGAHGRPRRQLEGGNIRLDVIAETKAGFQSTSNPRGLWARQLRS